MKKLNIGCGPKWKEQYPDHEGLDIIDYGQKHVMDVLDAGWELELDSYDEIIANHVIEHFNQDDVIKLLNICWFLLKPEGELKITVPHKDHIGAYDLDHKTFFTKRTFENFRSAEYRQKIALWPFDIRQIVVNDRPDIHVEMVKEDSKHWEYLDNKKRAKVIWDFIDANIESSSETWNYIFDFMCGSAFMFRYAPRRLLTRVFRYFGFDNDLRKIRDLNKWSRYRTWRKFDWATDMQVAAQSLFAVPLLDLYLHLGICPGTTNYESPTEAVSSVRLIRNGKPEHVVLEIAENINQQKLKFIQERIKDDYDLKATKTYSIEGHKNLQDRKIYLYVKKGDDTKDK